MMDKEKKLKESSGGGAATFTGASINPNDTASSLVAAGSKNGTAVVATSNAPQNKNTASKDNNGEAKIEGEVETKEVAKKKPKKAAAKKEK
jgi:hypothetical protein